MGLDLWLKDDIGNVLQGLALATPHMGAERSEAEAAAFREGFIAALTAAAVALGIAQDFGRAVDAALGCLDRGGSGGLRDLGITRQICRVIIVVSWSSFWHIGDLGGDHCPLAFVEVTAMQVQAHHVLDNACPAFPDGGPGVVAFVGV